MAASVTKLWSSIAFRQALIYGTLIVVTMAILLALFYVQTVGVWQRRIDRQIDAETQRLLVHFEQEGSAALQVLIDDLLSDRVASDTEVYLLIDPQGYPLLGNIAIPTSMATTAPGIDEYRVLRYGMASESRLRLTRLSDGSTLVVGRDMQDQRELEQLVRQASLAAALLTLLLAGGGAALFRSQLERRISLIRRTAARIEMGDLSERIPVSSQEDEFARLSREINAMLDRIHGLMDGVRHVSNTIAHNIRTPLSRILARLRTAQGDGDAGAMQNAVEFAIREIEDLNIVFDKLLQIAEVESGARRCVFEPVSVNAIMAEVLELYDAVAEECGIALTQGFDGSPTVNGDAHLLASAAANLVDNAIKYCHRGGSVHVLTHASDTTVTITVTDNGPGIPQSEHDRMGTRFYRLDHSKPGYGLGLASVIAIARLHGGLLKLKDGTPGLVASMVLPAIKPD